MTNRLPASYKINSMDSEYSELDETPTEVQIQGQRVIQLNPLACLNLESYDTPVRGQRGVQLLNPLTWLDRELYETRVKVSGWEFTLKQLIDATGKFGLKMELRRGRLGVLYKAELPNQSVAVEKMSQRYSEDIDKMRRKVLLRKQLAHENIVKLYDDCSIKKLNLLIYEYMESGSLDQALFESSPKVVLNWETRFNICLGVARGLRYLHNETSGFHVAYGSIEPTNVMLDATFKAKLTDFEFQWFRLDDDKHPNSSSFLHMAPELASRRAITPQADVYSYGNLLLEIVSGRPVAEYRPNQETLFLLDEMYALFAKGRELDLVDKRLVSYDRKQALIVLNLAKMCTDQSPSLRPTISEVIEILEGKRTFEEASKGRLGMI